MPTLYHKVWVKVRESIEDARNHAPVPAARSQPYRRSRNRLAPSRGRRSSIRLGDDTACSDLDVLVEPTDETTLMDIAAIQLELERLLGITVDVLTPNARPERFRSQVIAEAVPV